MSYINDWSHVTDGSTVMEDCSPEIYEIFTKNGERWLRQVGWHTLPHQKTPKVPDNEFRIDFKPHGVYCQPWILLD